MNGLGGKYISHGSPRHSTSVFWLQVPVSASSRIFWNVSDSEASRAAVGSSCVGSRVRSRRPSRQLNNSNVCLWWWLQVTDTQIRCAFDITDDWVSLALMLVSGLSLRSDQMCVCVTVRDDQTFYYYTDVTWSYVQSVLILTCYDISE